MDPVGRGSRISNTAMMVGPTAPTQLAAALSCNVIMTWDLETRRVTRQLLGHLHSIEGLTTAPGQ